MSSSPSPSSSSTLVVDVGAWSLKAGYAPNDSSNPPDAHDCHVVPNCIAKSRDNRTYIGSQLSQCADFGDMTFRRPVQKGYIVNWPLESAIWDDELQHLQCDAQNTNLVVTEPPNAPHQLMTNLDQMVFEYFDFASSYRAIAPSLNAYNDIPSIFGDSQTESPRVQPSDALLVIDSSHSHTTITPILHGRPIHPAIRRLDIGGKHLTNYLAELISLRHFSLMDEPHIVSQIKEDACFVTTAFSTHLDQSRHRDPSIVLDYVLPDYETHTRGFTRPHDPSHQAKQKRLGLNPPPDLHDREEVFPLANERFMVPELLFTPSDIGMPQSGIPDTVMQTLHALPRILWQPFLANILLVGGNTLLPGFVDRIDRDIRALAPAEMLVRVRRAKDPIKSTWQGGARLASEPDLIKDLLITRQEYQEHGSAWVARQFAIRKPHDSK